MTWVELGTLIKNRRKEINMTQEELAENAEISKSSIQRVEMGKMVNIKTLLQIYHVLKTDKTNSIFTLDEIYNLYFKN